jgi:formylmethanofuran dehydrogenase subunit E
VSTPGLGGDKFKVDHSIVTPVREKPKPGTRTCQKCGQNLKGKRFIDRDGIMLCESDWKEMFLPKVGRLFRQIPR